MSLLDDEETISQEADIQLLTIVKEEELFVKGFLKQGDVKAVCSKAPLLTKKLNEASKLVRSNFCEKFINRQ